ncbi:hypothetical protein CGRA01v4_05662 [Colletotrichum graminicola]|nr:hypothetical protein CGRA01v4_05662 [Colletotrichum graminicola]
MRPDLADVPLFGALNKEVVSSRSPGLVVSGAAERERHRERVGQTRRETNKTLPTQDRTGYRS